MRLQWQDRHFIADENHVYAADLDSRVRARNPEGARSWQSRTRNSAHGRRGEHRTELKTRELDFATRRNEVLVRLAELETRRQVAASERRQRALDAQRSGLRAGELASTLETALGGSIVSQVLEGQRVFDLVVRLDEPFRNSPDAIRRVQRL